MKPAQRKAVCQAIDILNGPSALAKRLFGDTAKQNVVSNWKQRGIPAEHAVTIAKWSGVPLAQLRPSMVRP